MMDHCGKDLRRGLPIEMQKKVLNFAQSLQAEDGFFYHPQWGREIPVPRKGRDYEWGRDIITELGGEFKYPLVSEQIKEKGTKTENLPEYMKSKEALVEYLDSFDIMHNSYRMGGTLGCQLFQIHQLGMLDICLDYYKDHQNKNNGVWQDSVNYHAVNGLMKIAGVFVTYGPFPNYDKAIDSCMEVMLSDEVPKAVVDFFNPWRAALEILEREGPALGRPLVDSVQGSKVKNLEELRPASPKGACIRILFAFDPQRSAVMLVAGDKSVGKQRWTNWYKEAVSLAEKLYGEHVWKLGGANG
jgi:hypothetical protein